MKMAAVSLVLNLDLMETLRETNLDRFGLTLDLLVRRVLVYLGGRKGLTHHYYIIRSI